MLVMNFLGDAISYGFHWILLWIDSVVYWAASKCYQLFMMIATSRIFEDDFFANFARRIYAILGVFMLFYLAYALLNAIVDPDKYSKGEKGVGNIAINFVISLVILGLVPTIFSYAYRVQNFILSEDVLGTVILGTKLHDIDENATIKFGDSVSFSVLNTFINPYNVPTSMGKSAGYTWFDCKKIILEESDYFCLTGLANPYVYKNDKDDIKYYGIISTIVGGYLVYLLFSFALDLGVRVVKLAFYQLIAPIPIIMRALPSKKTSFDKWLKKTLATYADVFVRVGFMYMSVYFISRIVTNTDIAKYLNNGFTGLLVLTILIIGIFTFAKQASKEISDILGVDAKINMGIKDKLKAGGPLGNLINNASERATGLVTGAAGGAWTSVVNGQGLRGAVYGGIEGWNKKGLQFGNQRQGLYEKYGGKGKAGWFGGRGFLNRVAADEKDHIIDDYKDRILPDKLKRFESSESFKGYLDAAKNKVRDKYKKLIEDNNQKIKGVEKEMKEAKEAYDSQYAERKARFDASRDGRVSALQGEYDSQKSAFEANKQAQIDALRSQLEQRKKEFEDQKKSRLSQLRQQLIMTTDSRKAAEINDQISNVESQVYNESESSSIRSQISALEAQTYSNDYLSSEIAKLKASEYEGTPFDSSEFERKIKNIEAKNKSYEQLLSDDENRTNLQNDAVTNVMYSELELEALGDARKEARDKNVKYSAELKARNERINEKATKQWLDSKEGQQQVAAYGAAQKRVAGKVDSAPKSDAPKK